MSTITDLETEIAGLEADRAASEGHAAYHRKTAATKFGAARKRHLRLAELQEERILWINGRIAKAKDAALKAEQAKP